MHTDGGPPLPLHVLRTSTSREGGRQYPLSRAGKQGKSLGHGGQGEGSRGGKGENIWGPKPGPSVQRPPSSSRSVEPNGLRPSAVHLHTTQLSRRRRVVLFTYAKQGDGGKGWGKGPPPRPPPLLAPAARRNKAASSFPFPSIWTERKRTQRKVGGRGPGGQ